MEYIFIWLVFGVISSIIASNKGNSGCGGFLLGVLLGPIGLLIVLFSSDNKPKVFNPVSYTRRCPFCAELVHNEAIVCKHCNRDIPIEIKAKNEHIQNSSDQKSQNKSLKFSRAEKTLFFSIALIILVIILARVFIPIYNESVAENEVINSHSLNNNPVKTVDSESLLKESVNTIKQSEDIIQTFKQLHSELMEFKSTEEFKIHGLSYTGPYSDWLMRVNDLKSHQNVNDLIKKGIVPADLQQLASEYISSKGKETEYTRNMNRMIKMAILP
jgi:cell division protein FtsL